MHPYRLHARGSCWKKKLTRQILASQKITHFAFLYKKNDKYYCGGVKRCQKSMSSGLKVRFSNYVHIFTLYRMVFTFSWASSILRTIETLPRHREKQFLQSVRMVKFSIKTKIFRAKIILFEKKSSKIFRKSENPKFYNLKPIIKTSDFSIFPKNRFSRNFLLFWGKSVRKIIFDQNNFRAEIFCFYWNILHSSRYTKLFLPRPRRPQTLKTTTFV